MRIIDIDVSVMIEKNTPEIFFFVFRVSKLHNLDLHTAEIRNGEKDFFVACLIPYLVRQFDAAASRLTYSHKKRVKTLSL